MIEAITRLSEAIELSNNSTDYAAIISAICSVISLIAIILLLIERYERKRPYLQVYFELKRSSLACLVIRNVGETSAILTGISFNGLFRKQLPPSGQKNIADRSNLNLFIHPKQEWVISLDVLTGEVIKYKNSKLDVTLSYRSNRRKKIYSETNIIEFEDYKPFLIYISEIDEVKKEVHSMAESMRIIVRSSLAFSHEEEENGMAVDSNR